VGLRSQRLASTGRIVQSSVTGDESNGTLTMTPNPITSADGGWRTLFAFLAQWPAAAEFLR
jgi:hypothetical protein